MTLRTKFYVTSGTGNVLFAWARTTNFAWARTINQVPSVLV